MDHEVTFALSVSDKSPSLLQIKMRGGESFELMSHKILLQLQDELTSEEPIFFGLSQLLQKFPKNIGVCNSDQGVVFQYIACNQF
jgi:hypothetical protein